MSNPANLSRRRPVVAIPPGKGVRCQWGQFGMRASPYAPPNIESRLLVSSVVRLCLPEGYPNICNKHPTRKSGGDTINLLCPPKTFPVGWGLAVCGPAEFLDAKRCSDHGRKKKRTSPGCGRWLSTLRPVDNSAQFFIMKYYVVPSPV